jgi:hypothetical protein
MSKYLFLSHASPSWKKRFGYVIAVAVLALVFALYSIPEVVIGLANQAWALCGW